MNKENLIHVRLEYDEALQSKKDLLSLELELIRTLKIIKEYKSKRINELKLKKKLKGRVGSTLIDIRKIQKTLPKVKINNIFKKEEKKEEVSEEIQKERINPHDITLEQELEEIQRKLMALQK